MITTQQKEDVWTLHSTKKMSNTDIALSIGISRPKVIEILKEPKWQNFTVIDKVNKLNEKAHQSLVDVLTNDKRIPMLFNRVLEELDKKDENEKDVITRLVEKDDIRPLMTVVGVFSDKNFAIKKLLMDERKIEIQERTLELKEKELNARIENPDLFNTVTVVNDSDKVNKWYREHGTDEPYIEN